MKQELANVMPHVHAAESNVCRYCAQNTECNRIRYTTLKMYCDQTNSNITTQFLTEHLLTLQTFLQVFSMAVTGYATESIRYSN
jgi:hypothetical protein